MLAALAAWFLVAPQWSVRAQPDLAQLDLAFFAWMTSWLTVGLAALLVVLLVVCVALRVRWQRQMKQRQMKGAAAVPAAFALIWGGFGALYVTTLAVLLALGLSWAWCSVPWTWSPRLG